MLWYLKQALNKDLEPELQTIDVFATFYHDLKHHGLPFAIQNMDVQRLETAASLWIGDATTTEGEHHVGASDEAEGVDAEARLPVMETGDKCFWSDGDVVFELGRAKPYHNASSTVRGICFFAS